ncbi:MAG: hypothetical protein GY835_22720, partial [bacterium]|nr:hypothetical protein [bacterium]
MPKHWQQHTFGQVFSGPGGGARESFAQPRFDQYAQPAGPSRLPQREAQGDAEVDAPTVWKTTKQIPVARPERTGGHDVSLKSAERTLLKRKDMDRMYIHLIEKDIEAFTEIDHYGMQESQRMGKPTPSARRIERLIRNDMFDPAQPLYRGMNGSHLGRTPAEILAKLNSGPISMADAMSSWSSKEEVGRNFAFGDEHEAAILFKTSGVMGSRSISAFSNIPEEAEVIISERARFQVVDHSVEQVTQGSRSYQILHVTLEPIHARVKGRTKKKKSRSKVGERSRANPYLTRKGGGERGRESFETHKLERWITIG